MEFYKVNKTIAETKAYSEWNSLFLNNTILTMPSSPQITNKKNPQIFISFTTCKRLPLFKKTINSILNHWDFHEIDYWFCVDDNSSIDDRAEMIKCYPWFDYVFKTSIHKGHRKSMNIIWDKLNELKPKYWIHMEDDFLFYDKMDYVKKSIEYLDELKNQNVKQILFNKNYGETIEHYRIEGDIPYNDEITIHDHKIGTFPYINCHYWPHYSFRPSMVLTEVILELGNYDSPNTFFERDYADRWNNAGYKSGFFNKLTNYHIGRLTSEINSGKPNAYTINNETQFN